METQIAQWSGLNQAVVDGAKKTGVINKNLLMSLTQQQMDIMGIYVEGGIKQMQTLAETRDPRALLTAQADLVQEFTKKLLNNFRVTFEIVMDARSEMNTLYQTQVQQASAQLIEFNQQLPQNMNKLLSNMPQTMTEMAEKMPETVKAMAEVSTAAAQELAKANTETAKEITQAVNDATRETQAMAESASVQVKTVAEKATNSAQTAVKTTTNRRGKKVTR